VTVTPRVDERTIYRIEVRGGLDDRWSEWFSGLEVAVENEGKNPPVTALIGPLDQAAMRGVVNKIWDLNLTLISIVPIE